MAGSNTTVPGTDAVSLKEGNQLTQATNLFALAWNAGFRGIDAVRAVAIAMAENGASQTNLVYQDPTGPAGPEYSIGLWQINIGTQDKSYDGFNAAQLTNPVNNAAAAFQKYKQAGGFGPWTTYTKGVYSQYMGIATAAGAGVNPGGLNDQLTNVLEHIATLTGSNSSPPGQGTGSGNPSGGGTGSGTTAGAGPSLSGVVVLIAGILAIIIGAIIWKGSDMVKVVSPSLTVKGPQKTVG